MTTPFSHPVHATLAPPPRPHPASLDLHSAHLSSHSCVVRCSSVCKDKHDYRLSSMNAPLKKKKNCKIITNVDICQVYVYTGAAVTLRLYTTHQRIFGFFGGWGVGLRDQAHTCIQCHRAQLEWISCITFFSIFFFWWGGGVVFRGDIPGLSPPKINDPLFTAHRA